MKNRSKTGVSLLALLAISAWARAQNGPAPANSSVAPAEKGNIEVVDEPTPTTKNADPLAAQPIVAPTNGLLGGKLFASSATCGDCIDQLCGPKGRVWASSEYLGFWMRGSALPPLVTASPAGTPRASAGVLGQPGTTTLFGNSNVNNDYRSGFRQTILYWLNNKQTIGIGGDFFFLENNGTNFAASSNGDPIISRPFFNATTGQQDAQLVAFPNVLNGGVTATTSSNGMWSAGALGYLNLCCDCNFRLDAFGGYRYYSFNDHLRISENLVSSNPGSVLVPLGTNINVQDAFDTENYFNGGEIGLRGMQRWNKFALTGLVAVALGNTQRQVDINGGTQVITPAGGVSNFGGGLLAQSSNIGHYKSNEFTAIPRLGLNVGYYVTPRIQVFMGYTFIWWGNVVRAGEQVDLGVNPSQIPPSTGTGTRPAFHLNDTSVWAQGISTGLLLHF